MHPHGIDRSQHNMARIDMNSSSKRLHVRLAVAVATAVGMVGAGSSIAATDTDNLIVSASVTATCTIATTPVAFGAYDPTSVSDLTATGAVTVLCTNGTAGYITLGEGANPNVASTPAVPLRQMAGGAAAAGRLGYLLYSEATRTAVWGNTGTTGLAHPGDGTSTALTVYGTIPAAQNVLAGSGGTAYADTVVATVTF
jgi:spore coat protein U-like protein